MKLEDFYLNLMKTYRNAMVNKMRTAKTTREAISYFNKVRKAEGYIAVVKEEK